MNNKYKIGDIVVLKKDFRKETIFLEKHEIFIIWNFTCNSKFINKRWKDYFLKKEKRYEIISINNLNLK